MPQVWNKRYRGYPKDAVYIGRPSKFGNPFIIGRHGTREEVIVKYREYLISSGLFYDLWELKGKDILCWCSPLACHGDILLELANII